MNLAAYDKISGVISKSKIYMSNNYPYIITREVKYRKYYCFVKRYEPNIKDIILYLVLLDDNPTDRSAAKVRRDNYGRLKFNLSRIKEYLNLNPNKNTNVVLTLETEADDGNIYKIELEFD